VISRDIVHICLERSFIVEKARLAQRVPEFWVAVSFRPIIVRRSDLLLAKSARTFDPRKNLLVAGNGGWSVP
jgi:hypothetical protein